jgi:nitroimidazol reductase NimA-like FMN-containing flavoprotein (pyridoxamine 5'-phosphate oxidase superfamily)
MTAAGQILSGEPLSHEDCLARLGEADLARVVLSVRALPAALPARISLTGEDHLVLASSEEAVILAARRGDVISVQIDGLEPDGTTWSVMASGIAAGAPEDEVVDHRLRTAVEHGATLLSLPLSIVTGRRSR